MALTRGVRVGVVETAEPQSAYVSSKRPFSNPNVVLEVLSVAHVATILVAVGADVIVRSTPGEVLMGVHDNVLVVTVLEEIVPEICVEVESVMEDKLQVRLLLLHHRLHISVELLQHIKIGGPPGLVYGLNSVNSGVSAPSVEETLDGVLCPVNVVVIDALVGA